MLYSGFYFTFTVAMITKKGGRIRLKIEKLPFCAKFKAFGDRFFKELGISTSEYQTNLLIHCML